MGPIDLFLLLINFFAPAVGLGVIAGGLAKCFWWGALRSVSWLRLASWGFLASAAVQVLGLLAFGHDGKIMTYACMVLACAVALGWAGFGPRRG